MMLAALFLTLSVHAAPKCYTAMDVRNMACDTVCLDRKKDGGAWDTAKKRCYCKEYIDTDDGKPITVFSAPHDELSGGWFMRFMQEFK